MPQKRGTAQASTRLRIRPGRHDLPEASCYGLLPYGDSELKRWNYRVPCAQQVRGAIASGETCGCWNEREIVRPGTCDPPNCAYNSISTSLTSDITPTTFSPQTLTTPLSPRCVLLTMRLINIRTIELESFVGSHIPKYAILSHRWESDEVTYQEMSQPKTFGKKAFAKIQSACWQARNKGLGYLWVDTCCIDKRSSVDVDEAINSMYTWYHQADICFAYLSDITFPQHQIKDSVWLTRGWTLQELIAPKVVTFHDRNWVFLGTKVDLAQHLSVYTGIPLEVLTGQNKASSCSIAQRMSWASKRETERPEDRAYSLLGIFDVNLPSLYGEGEKKSFARLQQEILRQSDDPSIFAWDRGVGGTFDGYSSILATSPTNFTTCQNVVRSSQGLHNTGNFKITNIGLSITLMTIPWTMETYLGILQCTLHDSPYARLGIFLERLSSPQIDEQYARVSFNGNTVVCIPLQRILQDTQARVRHVYVRPEICDNPLRRWHGFRLHEFDVPDYSLDELSQTRFHYRNHMSAFTRYSTDEIRHARHHHPEGLEGLPPRPLFFGMPHGRSDGMEPIRGTTAIIFIPPSTNRDRNRERICWMKLALDKDFAPTVILGRQKSLWGGTAPHLAAYEDAYYDAEEQPGKHALLFRSDWVSELAPCIDDREIAERWRLRDCCVLRGHHDYGLDQKIPFLRLHISIKLEVVPSNYPTAAEGMGRPASLKPGMSVWTVNVRTSGDGGRGMGSKGATTGELLLRGIDEIFMAL